MKSNHTLSQQVGVKIRKIRELKDLSQDSCAKMLGMAQQTYSKIETGETDLTLNRLEQIANLMGVSIDALINADKRSMMQAYSQAIGDNSNSHQINNDIEAILDKVVDKVLSSVEKGYDAHIESLKEEINWLRKKTE